ncbi:MAG: cysteine desulfurase [Phycisphaeraceae bacterium]|nr:cysteine desulfurase [Phycisphaeraceae bacterium]
MTTRTTTSSYLTKAHQLREDFPILGRQVHGKPLVYLDNAATTQKPASVIGAIGRYYESANANVHRGVHALSQEATELYEGARAKLRDFIGAASEQEIIFVRGATEALNLIAFAYGRSVLKPGREVLITAMEHHSNIVPWQMVCQQTGATLRVAPIDDRGQLIWPEFQKLITDKTAIVAATHVSNALGTINPVAEMAALAHRHGAVMIVDGAQAVSHMPVNVAEIGCDFYAFSGHKMFGPMGVGVLYGRKALLETMPPWQGGGDMIRSVTFEKTTYNDLPYKFEAGTPDVAGAVGLGAAVDYLRAADMTWIEQYEHELLAYGESLLSKVPGLKLIGQTERRAAVLSFVFDDIHPHDAGTVLDTLGVAVRTGHHCAQPVMDRFDVPATIRASLAFYNTPSDLDALASGLGQVIKMFRG